MFNRGNKLNDNSEWVVEVVVISGLNRSYVVFISEFNYYEATWILTNGMEKGLRTTKMEGKFSYCYIKEKAEQWVKYLSPRNKAIWQVFHKTEKKQRMLIIKSLFKTKRLSYLLSNDKKWCIFTWNMNCNAYLTVLDFLICVGRIGILTIK